MKSKILELLGVEKLLDTIQKIIEVRISLIKEEAQQKIAGTLSTLLPLLLFLLSLLSLILFCSLTLAFYLAELCNSVPAGFGLVSLFYLVLSIIFYFVKDSKRFKEKVKSEIQKRN